MRLAYGSAQVLHLTSTIFINRGLVLQARYSIYERVSFLCLFN